MIFQHAQTNKSTQILQDLININNDRISAYQSALKLGNIDSSIKDAINDIIADGVYYRQQLVKEVNKRDAEVKNMANILGKIYMAWNDLKVTLAANTQRAVISSCMYNEKIALHAYQAALSKDAGISNNLLQMLEEQEDGLKKNYELLRYFHEMHRLATSSLSYLV